MKQKGAEKKRWCVTKLTSEQKSLMVRGVGPKHDGTDTFYLSEAHLEYLKNLGPPTSVSTLQAKARAIENFCKWQQSTGLMLDLTPSENRRAAANLVEFLRAHELTPRSPSPAPCLGIGEDSSEI